MWYTSVSLACATKLSTLGIRQNIRYVWNMSTTGKTGGQKNAHARTRRDHATELAEDYVEAIDDLVEETGACRVTDLARHFGVSHVTAHRTIARLVRDGFADTRRYAPVTLTKKGRALAKKSRERHEIVRQFLLSLGISEQTAQLDAEGIEHHVSPETLDVMKQFTAKHQEETG